MSIGPIQERNQGTFVANLQSFNKLYCAVDATIYVGGLDEKVTEALLWELFVQAGPIGY